MNFILFYIVSQYKFLKEILDINPKVRFAAIYYDADYYSEMREGLKPFLSKEETEKSLRHAIVRMGSRKLLAQKTGDVHYCLGKYDNMCRITIPFGQGGIIMCTTEIDAKYDMIAEKIIELRKNFEFLLA